MKPHGWKMKNVKCKKFRDQNIFTQWKMKIK